MKKSKQLAAMCLVFTSLTSASSAAVVLAPTRASLGANDFVSWGQLGAPVTVVAAPFSALSDLGLVVTGDMPVQRRNQNNGWFGNFNSGEELIFSVTSGALTLTFSSPVSAAGFNIQSNTFGIFDASIEAFDGSNNSLGIFSIPGFSSSSADGTAVFLGITSDVINIKSIAFSISGSTSGFAINELALNTTDVSVIPEPSNVLALALLLTSGVMFRNRRRKG